MVRTALSKSVNQVSDSQDKSRSRKSKFRDGGTKNDRSGNHSKQSPMSTHGCLKRLFIYLFFFDQNLIISLHKEVKNAV